MLAGSIAVPPKIDSIPNLSQFAGPDSSGSVSSGEGSSANTRERQLVGSSSTSATMLSTPEAADPIEISNAPRRNLGVDFGEQLLVARLGDRRYTVVQKNSVSP